RGKTMKAANTIFAQDNQSNTILYARSDILRREGSQEVKKFISYWKKIKGNVNETLVFDCNFTKYEILDELAGDNIKFITLRKRNKTLIKNTWAIPKDKWQKINIPIPKRKYQKVSVYENKEKSAHV
ncbi:MAG: transposase, partial [Elusimicrobiota bacterium]